MKVIHREIGKDAMYKIWNTTDEYMIIFFGTDGGSLVFSDAIYPIERGAICFVSPSNPHYTMPDNPQEYIRSKIFISEKSMRAILDSVSQDSTFHRLFSENDAVYAKIPENDIERVNKMLDEAVSRFCDGGREDGIVATFFYLMTLISDGAVHHIKAPDNFMTAAIEYINSAYSEQISLDELCRVVNMSKSHFCRKFKDTMGMTVMDYIFTTRIAAAKTLLISSNLSVSQISERCGFSSISYFCQKFKEKTGVTANSFKKRAGQKNSSFN